MLKFNREQGFTLLETIVAIGIISTGVLSIITLGMVILGASRKTSRNFQAHNFSREGLELVRSARDSNWLAIDSNTSGVTWRTGLFSIGDYTAVPTIFDYASSGNFVEFDVDTAGDTCDDANGIAYDCSAIWYDSTNERYFQTTEGADPGDTFDSTDAAYSQTEFQRILSLYPICRNDADPTDEIIITSGTCGAGYTQVGLDVRSAVYFDEEGSTQTVTLEEYIYDWKY